MNEILSAAKELGDFMRQRQWEYCIIGGLAVIRWGEPRLTQDWLDIQGLMTRQGGRLERSYILGHLEVLSALKEAPETMAQTRSILGT